ncbi:MAG: 50S ribosomal protein L18 [Candidatus Micrarchaeia archaeon]
MAKQTTNIRFRRRREGKTNYAKRLALVKSGMYRVVVRKTNRRVIGQVIEYKPMGDRVVASAESKELEKLGWPSRCNKPTAYLTGMLLANKFAGVGKECILDIGLSASGKNSVPFAFAKGCLDNGMKLRGTFEIKEDAYDGSEIAKYAALLAEDKETLNKQFGAYLKQGTKPEELQKLFKAVAEKIKSMRK